MERRGCLEAVSMSEVMQATDMAGGGRASRVTGSGATLRLALGLRRS